MTAFTLSCWAARWKARTASAAELWSSYSTISTLRPFTPPAALISSAASLAPLGMATPLIAEVSAMTPILIGSSARAAWDAMPRPNAAASRVWVAFNAVSPLRRSASTRQTATEPEGIRAKCRQPKREVTGVCHTCG